MTPDKPRGRPPRELAARIRQAVLDKAAEEFLRQGYGQASVASIIEAAGISTKTFYAKFSNKEDLLFGVVGSLVSRSTERLDGIFGSPVVDVLEELAMVVREIASHWLNPQEVEIYRLIVAESGRHPEIGRAYIEGVEPFMALVATALGGRYSATLRVGDPEAAARQLVALTCDGIKEAALLGAPLSDEEAARVMDEGLSLFVKAST